jgi:hypothetical protein
MTLRHSGGDSSTLHWLKSSYSTNDGPDCVEVAADGGEVRVRDSKAPGGPQLALSAHAWAGFVRYAADAR